METITKKKEDKKEGQTKTKEFTSGKFFSQIQSLSKTDHEKRERSKPAAGSQLSSRKLKL